MRKLREKVVAAKESFAQTPLEGGDGVDRSALSYDEFGEALRFWEPRLTKREVHGLSALVDVKGGGEVDMYAFAKIIEAEQAELEQFGVPFSACKLVERYEREHPTEKGTSQWPPTRYGVGAHSVDTSMDENNDTGAAAENAVDVPPKRGRAQIAGAQVTKPSAAHGFALHFAPMDLCTETHTGLCGEPSMIITSYTTATSSELETRQHTGDAHTRLTRQAVAIHVGGGAVLPQTNSALFVRAASPGLPRPGVEKKMWAR
jgi:hypothetical protein